MPYTLPETLRQIDPFVQLNDGRTVATVTSWLMCIDHRDLTEYAMTVDSAGRLLIYRLDLRGFPVRPPAFIEQKPSIIIPAGKRELKPTEFGFSAPGCV